jgi:hypothetical protein
MLGAAHPLTQQYGQFVDHYSQKDLFYRGRLQALKCTQAPARILRYVQLRLVNWFRDARQLNVHLPPPDFSSALTSLSLCETAWLPDLPSRYNNVSNNTTSFNFPTTIGSSHSIVSRPGRTDAESAVSGLTHHTTSVAAPPSSKKARPNRDKVDNHHRNTKFDQYTDAINSSTLTDTVGKFGQPPQLTRNGNTTHMCASNHLKGKCWSNCMRAADHCQHTAAEDALLLSWCARAYA